MTALRISPFSGLIPKADPTMLPANAAQQAANCRFSAGQLEAYNAPLFIQNAVRSDIQTLYRFGQANNSDTEYWFQWPSDVNCVKGAVANDVEERTFYTGDGFPKQTNNAIATSASPYPASFFRIGLPPPPPIASIVANGTRSSTAAAPEQRAYIYTLVSQFGEESPPCGSGDEAVPAVIDVYGASSEVTVQGKEAVAEVKNPDGTIKTAAQAAIAEVRVEYPAQTVGLSFPGVSLPSASPIPQFKRIYRSLQGSSEYFFVDEISYAQSAYTDSKTAEQLGEICPTLDSANIPDAARGLVALPNGIMVCHTEYDVYFSEPYKPYSWPGGYALTVDYPIVGLGVFGTSVAVLTKGYPYVITGTDPQSMAMERLPMPYACLSKRSICTAMGGVIYAAADGLVQITPGGVSVLTEALFTRREWNAYQPTSMMCCVWDDRIFIFNRISEQLKGAFIFDQSNGLTATDIYASAAYTDPVTGSLFLVVDSQIVKWDAGAEGSFVWKSRRETLPMPTNFSYGQILATKYPQTVIVHTDLESATDAIALNARNPALARTGSVVAFTATVTSSQPFRLPSGFKARYWELELRGNGRVLSAVLSESGEELQRV